MNQATICVCINTSVDSSDILSRYSTSQIVAAIGTKPNIVVADHGVVAILRSTGHFTRDN